MALTVSQLIARLSNQPQDALVIMKSSDRDGYERVTGVGIKEVVRGYRDKNNDAQTNFIEAGSELAPAGAGHHLVVLLKD
ncbi:hypothetical protein [Pseudomonas sp. TWR3-1-1]|uniref:hypothetical protein n=1 Tax=Pseudomonas sp. TWR3-1-1 TaxID=2804633 RepID=UPI003CF05DC6